MTQVFPYSQVSQLPMNGWYLIASMDALTQVHPLRKPAPAKPATGAPAGASSVHDGLPEHRAADFPELAARCMVARFAFLE